jgi:predicted HTH transcriptional regulator
LAVTTTRQILRLIAARPRTNAELQELCIDHSGGIARTMSKLIAKGHAKRIDGGSGRGSIAIYAAAEDRQW